MVTLVHWKGDPEKVYLLQAWINCLAIEESQGMQAAKLSTHSALYCTEESGYSHEDSPSSCLPSYILCVNVSSPSWFYTGVLFCFVVKFLVLDLVFWDLYESIKIPRAAIFLWYFFGTPWYFFQLCLWGSREPFKKYWRSGLQNQAEKALAMFSLIHLWWLVCIFNFTQCGVIRVT